MNEKNNNMADYVMLQQPPVVGYWSICGGTLKFNLTIRPSKWHQFWCAYLIGWKWIDHDVDNAG